MHILSKLLYYHIWKRKRNKQNDYGKQSPKECAHEKTLVDADGIRKTVYMARSCAKQSLRVILFPKLAISVLGK